MIIDGSQIIRIDECELVRGIESCAFEEQLILKLLQDKGAPIDGTIWLSINKDYDWTKWEERLLNCTYWKFTKRL